MLFGGDRPFFAVLLKNMVDLENRILGICVNGLSTQIEVLDFAADQSKNDFICNISLLYNDNGNGKYNIDFFDKKLTPGCLIGGWRVTSGYIDYDWGKSKCYFYLTDSSGNATNKIFALNGKGFVSGFDVKVLAKAILPKAVKIIIKYPSAEVYNLYRETELALNSSDVSAFREKLNVKDYLDSLINKSYPKVNLIITNYKRLEALLSINSDERSKILLQELRAQVYQLFHKFLGMQ